MNIFLKTLLFIIISVGFVACGKPQESAYQQQVAIPNHNWYYTFQPTFTFEIPDTNANYKVFVIIRHDAAYKICNLWLRVKTKAVDSKTFDAGNRVECTLAAPDGQWLGNNVGGLYEHKILLTPGAHYPKFNKAGSYTIQLEQISRENPLASVYNIGLRVERLNAK